MSLGLIPIYPKGNPGHDIFFQLLILIESDTIINNRFVPK
jgi:hypothetical protein